MQDGARCSKVTAFARGYHIPLIDYGPDLEDQRRGLLVSSGAGVMMAAMDACPAFRWCLDIDALGARSSLVDFLLGAERYVQPLGVVGWFSITDPEPLRRALRRLRTLGRVLVYTPGARVPGGYDFNSLEEFVEAANQPQTSLTAHEAGEILAGAHYV
jgi:hypothetical protein